MDYYRKIGFSLDDDDSVFIGCLDIIVEIDESKFKKQIFIEEEDLEEFYNRRH